VAEQPLFPIVSGGPNSMLARHFALKRQQVSRYLFSSSVCAALHCHSVIALLDLAQPGLMVFHSEAIGVALRSVTADKLLAVAINTRGLLAC